jgi:hypothetical protein
LLVEVEAEVILEVVAEQVVTELVVHYQFVVLLLIQLQLEQVVQVQQADQHHLGQMDQIQFFQQLHQQEEVLVVLM